MKKVISLLLITACLVGFPANASYFFEYIVSKEFFVDPMSGTCFEMPASWELLNTLEQKDIFIAEFDVDNNESTDFAYGCFDLFSTITSTIGENNLTRSDITDSIFDLSSYAEATGIDEDEFDYVNYDGKEYAQTFSETGFLVEDMPDGYSNLLCCVDNGYLYMFCLATENGLSDETSNTYISEFENMILSLDYSKSDKSNYYMLCVMATEEYNP